MTQLSIFKGTASTTSFNDSDPFYDAIALYIVNPTNIDEIEVEIFIQFEVTPTSNRLIKIFEGYILDTETLIRLPYELRNSLEKKYLVILPSENIELEVWAIYDDQPSLLEIETKVNDIKSQLTRIEIEQVAIGYNQLGQNTAIELISTTLGVGLATVTGGTSLALPGAVTGVLAQPTATLAPLLLPGI